jgi:carboxylesterase type B
MEPNEIRSKLAATATCMAFLAMVAITPFICSCSSDSGNPSACATGLVSTTSGVVCGKGVSANGQEVHAFLGIPYAESTGGDNRWCDPIPKAEASGVIHATAFGPGCPQELNPPYTPDETSEDCLSLNIWRPANTKHDALLPVMVWIYGGSFQTGGSAMPIYDGAWLAATENVLVVSFNYRLGALGFLAGIHGLEGNYGIKDQQLALQWVQHNIANFGGDPDQVTLFGESAGAMSVGLHTLSIPSSEALFRAAIMQSNPFGIPYKTVDEATPEATILETELGCSGKDIDCLRAVSADAIVQEQGDAAIQMVSLLGLHLAGFLVWSPVIDGTFLTEDPTTAAAAGELNVPTVLGTTHDEGVLFVNDMVGAFGGNVDAATYTMVLTLIFGADHTPDIIARYGINPTGDNTEYLVQITTDYLFGCANRFVATQATSLVYAYEFNENSINVWPDVVACDGKACHGDDIPFTFHTDTQLGIQFTAEQDALSNAMMGYWSAFAARMNPDVDGLPAWPPFTPSLMEYMILTTPERYVAVDPIANCDFWDQIGYDLRPPSLEAAAAVLASLGR